MEIKVPSSWDEVSIKQFEQLMAHSNNENLTIAEREMFIISTLTGLTPKEVRELDVPSFQQISNTLGFLGSPVPKRLPKDKITINGSEYHVDLYPKNFSAGQFIDYKTIAASEVDKKSARIIACFLYPEGSQYNDGSYDADFIVNEIYEHLGVPEVTAYSNFFMIQYKAYAEAFLKYSLRQVKKSKVIPKQERKEQITQLKRSIALIRSIGV